MTDLMRLLTFRYHKQANNDSEIVHRRVQQLLQQTGQAQDSISENEIKMFCRHAYHIDVLRGSCIADEYSSNISSINDLGEDLYNYLNNSKVAFM